MANVYLLSAAAKDRDRIPKYREELGKLEACAKIDRFRVHHVVQTPDEADLVLFVESSTRAGAYFERVKAHPVYRSWRDKSYLFSSTDRIVPFLPGVYASVESSWYWPNWTRSGHYLGIREQGYLRYESEAGSPPYLFSFVGSSSTHPVRRRIMQLRHSDALMLDTQAERNHHVEGGDREHERAYAESIKRSAFVLCPRGGGASTFRLFETMMLGRVPVVISDEWVPPRGPEWEKFSIRIPETKVEDLPAILETRAGDASKMGAAARVAWLDWFSEAVSFHRIVEWCLELDRVGASRAGVRRYLPYLQMLRPYHSARWIGKRLGHGESWRSPTATHVAASLGQMSGHLRSRSRARL